MQIHPRIVTLRLQAKVIHQNSNIFQICRLALFVVAEMTEVKFLCFRVTLTPTRHRSHAASHVLRDPLLCHIFQQSVNRGYLLSCLTLFYPESTIKSQCASNNIPSAALERQAYVTRPQPALQCCALRCRYDSSNRKSSNAALQIQMALSKIRCVTFEHLPPQKIVFITGGHDKFWSIRKHLRGF